MGVTDDIRHAFKAYLEDSDSYGDFGWKSIIIDLFEIACYEKESSFSDDAIFGLRYLYETIYYIICRTTPNREGCGDDKACQWLREYAKIWLAGGTDFPLFPRGCYYNTCKCGSFDEPSVPKPMKENKNESAEVSK